MNDGSFFHHLVAVIDLRHGQAVHAVAGKRDQYQPVTLRDGDAGDAVELAAWYRLRGIGSIYIADLDAIIDDAPQVDLVRRLANYFPKSTTDAGRHAIAANDAIRDVPGARVIISTECFANPDEWVACRHEIATPNIVLGLDLIGEQVRCSDATRNHPIATWIEAAGSTGVTDVVALDLSFVGTRTGPKTAGICRLLKSRWPGFRLTSGGGVGSTDDVRVLVDAGCDHVLVATALLDGTL